MTKLAELAKENQELKEELRLIQEYSNCEHDV